MIRDAVSHDDHVVHLRRILLHHDVHRVARDSLRSGYVADVAELQAGSTVGNGDRVAASGVGDGADGRAGNQDGRSGQGFALMVEDCSRHGVARHVEVVAGRDETVFEPPGLQFRGDAPGIGVRRGERQGDVLPLLSGVLENIGLVGDLHRLRQPARTDVVRGEPAGVADVVGQRERRLAGRGGFDPHLHFAHRVRLSAAQIHQFGQNLPSALVDFLFFRVEVHGSGRKALQ